MLCPLHLNYASQFCAAKSSKVESRVSGKMEQAAYTFHGYLPVSSSKLVDWICETFKCFLALLRAQQRNDELYIHCRSYNYFDEYEGTVKLALQYKRITSKSLINSLDILLINIRVCVVVAPNSSMTLQGTHA